MRRGLPLLLLCSLATVLSACAPEGPSAFVTFNIPPDSNCTYSPDATANLFIPQGLYDISAGGKTSTSDQCDKPYRVHLLVNSYLRSNSDQMLGRAEPNILQLHSAEVRLMTLQRETLVFDDADPPLPNPFLVTTNNSLYPATGSTPSSGIAAVEVIPSAYAPFLGDFDGDQILAEIQILGTTTGDVDVEFKPFDYPIEICDGCLTTCISTVEAAGKTADDVVGGDCADNAGADGRYCIDYGC